MAKRRMQRAQNGTQRLVDPYRFVPTVGAPISGYPVSGTSEYAVAGFAEEAGGQQPPVGESGTSATERQLLLKARMLSVPADEVQTAFESGEYTVEDALDATLASLQRSNVIAKEMIVESRKSGLKFDRRARKIKAQLDDIDRKLAELVGDGR